MRVALIDGDELAYKVALRYQQVWHCTTKDNIVQYRFKYKEEAIESIADRLDLDIIQEIEAYPPNGMEEMLDTYISGILLATNSTDMRLYLSGDQNFRYSFATLTPYKGNRVKENKPIYLEHIKNLMRTRGAEEVSFLEADDMMSSGIRLFDEAVICSTDKDLRTVPGWNYNISTQLFQNIVPEKARHNFFKQLLIGDCTDAIPSPFNLGEVGAEKFLRYLFEKKERDYYQAIVPFYKSWLDKRDKVTGEYKTKWYKDQDIHDILFEIGNLLWMRRTRDEEERWSIPLEFKNA
jgi:hypothetical protein